MTYAMLPLLLWLGAVGGGFVDMQKRIIGGQPCKREYHIKLRGVTATGSANLCGGSLITDRWILTAAHCYRPLRTMFAQFGDPAQEVEITEKPVIYTDKDQKGNDRIHDIMLLKLPEPSTLQPVDLPDCSNPPSKVEIAGHAATSGGPNNERRPGGSPVLHCADIDIVNCENLANTVQTYFPLIYDVKQYQHWCCGQTTEIDICYGDSGGGVVYDNKIYGVISFLGDPKKVCKEPFAFMDVCHPDYNTWIRNTTS